MIYFVRAKNSDLSSPNFFSVLNKIGNTPLIKLSKINPYKADLFAKLENLNPSGSIKDVMAAYMVKMAEKKGKLKPGSRIIEVTTGNTGISFAMISAIKGYNFTAVMPENISSEKKRLLQALGAKLVLTPVKENMAGAVKKYEQLVKKYPDAWLPRQFENPDNIIAHMEITGQEILKEIKKVDAFVAGVGTGGTLMGVAEALRKVNPKVKIIAVEPAESAVLSGGKPGPHQIEGIGEGFIPKLVDMTKIDEIVQIRSKDAIQMTKKLAKKEGLLVGISSGANVIASLKIAKQLGKGHIVTVLPDSGERYLSKGVF